MLRSSSVPWRATKYAAGDASLLQSIYWIKRVAESFGMAADHLAARVTRRPWRVPEGGRAGNALLRNPSGWPRPASDRVWPTLPADRKKIPPPTYSRVRRPPANLPAECARPTSGEAPPALAARHPFTVISYCRNQRCTLGSTRVAEKRGTIGVTRPRSSSYTAPTCAKYAASAAPPA